jgi:hypothetical protein
MPFFCPENQDHFTAKLLSDFFRGDKTAKSIVSKLTLRPARPKFKLGPTGTPEQLERAYEDVLKAVADGKLTVQEAKDFTGMILGKRGINEYADVEPRIRALEEERERRIKEERDTQMAGIRF